ncbi:hypothetical protein ES707_22345 [subsurface metagenome]
MENRENDVKTDRNEDMKRLRKYAKMLMERDIRTVHRYKHKMLRSDERRYIISCDFETHSIIQALAVAEKCSFLPNCFTTSAEV